MECICIYEMYGYSLSFVFLESGKAVRSEFRFHVVSVYDLLVDPRISNISDIGDGDGER